MLEKTFTFDRFVRLIIGIAIAVAVLCVMQSLSAVLLPFFVGWLLAYLLYPLVCFVQYRMHVRNRALSILLTFVFVGVVIGGMAWLIVPPMLDQFERLGGLVSRYLHEVTNIQNFPAAVKRWLMANDDSISNFFNNEGFTDTMRRVVPQLYKVINRTADMLLSIVASLITLLYMFFILLDYETISNGLVKIAPKDKRPFWSALISDVEHELNCYMRGQALVALCIGILFCIGFTLIGFPIAIAMGIMIGVMSLIPYLHSLALIPIVLLSLLKAADTGESFWVILLSALAVFAFIQLITDMVLTPKIMGTAMRLNPAILLLSLSVWGSLLGFIGLIIALPLTTIIIAYYQRYITKDVSNEKNNESAAVPGTNGGEDAHGGASGAPDGGKRCRAELPEG